MKTKSLIAGMLLSFLTAACFAADTNPPAISPVPQKPVAGVSATAVTIGEWTSAQLTKPGVVLEWDITKQVSGPGECQVSFNYTRGAHGLDISSVALLEDGTEIARDAHAGFSGGSLIDHVYTLNLAALKADAKYTVQATVTGRGGPDSFGSVSWSPQPAGEKPSQ